MNYRARQELKELLDSPTTRGVVNIAGDAGALFGELPGAIQLCLKVIFKPAFMEYAQNYPYPRDTDHTFLYLGQILRLLPPALVVGFVLMGGNNEVDMSTLNFKSLLFTTAVAFLGTGMVDATGLALQSFAGDGHPLK